MVRQLGLCAFTGLIRDRGIRILQAMWHSRKIMKIKDDILMLVCRLPCVVLCLVTELCPTLCEHTDCEVVLKKKKTGEKYKGSYPRSTKKKQTWFRCNGRK